MLKGLRYAPRVIVTDELKSYAAAKRKTLPVSSTASRYLNNPAEVSHHPSRGLAPSDRPTRTTDEAPQVSASWAALSLHHNRIHATSTSAVTTAITREIVGFVWAIVRQATAHCNLTGGNE